jgi:phytoene dehydrogenase-like protein
VSRDRVPHRPFLIVAQPSLFDPTRGGHVLWVYAHVPHGWRGDLTEAVEARIEAFAPGFGDTVLARTATGPAAIAAHNPNYAGGDIGGGRPIVPRHPYATGDPAVFYCSAATPPGPGVHGMCGYHAARRALRRLTG